MKRKKENSKIVKYLDGGGEIHGEHLLWSGAVNIEAKGKVNSIRKPRLGWDQLQFLGIPVVFLKLVFNLCLVVSGGECVCVCEID